jgi:hypothetical protein
LRRPDDVIHHSDQRSQYTSIAFGKRCRDVGMRPSPGSVDDCYDNAMCESFFTTVKCELLDRHRFRSRAEALMAVFEFLEGRDNPRRRHSAIGYLSPINYERSQLSPLAQTHNRPRNRGNSNSFLGLPLDMPWEGVGVALRRHGRFVGSKFAAAMTNACRRVYTWHRAMTFNKV